MFYPQSNSSPEEPEVRPKTARTESRSSPGARPVTSTSRQNVPGPQTWPSPLPPNRRRFNLNDLDDDDLPAQPMQQQSSKPVIPGVDGLTSSSDEPVVSPQRKRQSDDLRSSFGIFTDEQVMRGMEQPSIDDDGDVTIQLNGRTSRRLSTVSCDSDSDVTRNVLGVTGLVGIDERGDPMDVSPAPVPGEEVSKPSDPDSDIQENALAALLNDDEDEEDGPTLEPLPSIRASRISLAPLNSRNERKQPSTTLDEDKDVLPNVRAPRISLAPLASNYAELEQNNPSQSNPKDDLVHATRGSRDSLAPIASSAGQGDTGAEIDKDAIPGIHAPRISLAPLEPAAVLENDMSPQPPSIVDSRAIPQDMDDLAQDVTQDDDTCITLQPIDAMALQNAVNERARRSSVASDFEVNIGNLGDMIARDEDEMALPSIDQERPLTDVEPSHVRKLFDSKGCGEEDTLHFEVDNQPGPHISGSVSMAKNVPTEKDRPGTKLDLEDPDMSTTPQAEHKTAHISPVPTVTSRPVNSPNEDQAPSVGNPLRQEEAAVEPVSEKPSVEESLAQIREYSTQVDGVDDAELTPRSEKHQVPLMSTPRSATAFKIQEIMDERSSAKHTRSAPAHTETFDSALGNPNPVDLSDELNVSGTSKHTLADFQDVCQDFNFIFSIPADTGREGSIAPLQSASNINRFSTAGLVYEGAQEESQLRHLEKCLENIENQMLEDLQEIENMNAELERTSPKAFVKVCQLKRKRDTTLFSLHLKRLYKISSHQAKHHWVSSRQEWEKGIKDSIERQIKSMNEDGKSLQDSEGEIVHLKEKRWSEGTDKSLTIPEEDVVVMRRTVVHEVSFVRDLRKFVATQEVDEDDINRQRSKLMTKKARLSASCKKLESYAGADTFEKLKKMATEKKELNMILYGMTGLKPLHLKKNNIILRAFDMVDMNFSIHDDRVINVSCKPVEYPWCPKEWQTFLDGVAKMTGSASRLRDVEFVRDISHTLFCSTGAIICAKAAFEDVAQYLSERMGKLVSVSLNGGSEIELRVLAEFYSWTKRCKFDVTACWRTSAENKANGIPRQTIEVVEMTRHFGAGPSDDAIRRTIESVNLDGTAVGNMKLSAGLNNIWSLLA